MQNNNQQYYNNNINDPQENPLPSTPYAQGGTNNIHTQGQGQTPASINDADYDIQAVMTHIGEVIKVIGVGGGGCNAVDGMVNSGVKNVEFICANTDAKALSRNKAHHLLQLGHGLTRGLGAGSQPEVGKKAAMEDREKIAALLKGTDMLFIAAGMGGGTGTGAAPVIADIAKSLNILTVGVVTKPFTYEGEKRKKTADSGIEELKRYVDSLIVLPNEKLLSELNEEVSMRDAFSAADNVLKGAVLGITEVIKTPGVISLDFADVKTVMQGRGLAMMGSAHANGSNRATEAAQRAIFSPLLDDVSLDGAKGVLVNISSAPGSLKMKEYHDILGLIQDHVHYEADFKAGMAEIDSMDENEICVTVIATGLNDLKTSTTFDEGLFRFADGANNINGSYTDTYDANNQNNLGNSNGIFANSPTRQQAGATTNDLFTNAGSQERQAHNNNLHDANSALGNSDANNNQTDARPNSSGNRGLFSTPAFFRRNRS